MNFESFLRSIVTEAVRDALTIHRTESVPREPPLPSAFSNELLPVSEVAKLCHVTPATVRAWISRGQLPSSRPGHQHLVRRADLDDFLRQQGPLPNAPQIDEDQQVVTILHRLNRKQKP